MNHPHSDINELQNPYNEDKVHDACGLFGIMNTAGKRFSANEAIRAMANMHDRGNGLGAGFAIYGLYPDYKDDYALHVMYLDDAALRSGENFIGRQFEISYAEDIPVNDHIEVTYPPLLKRYFVQPKGQISVAPEEFVKDAVIQINAMGRSFVFSSGKDMGIFKGVGYPEDLSEYFRLKDYEGYMWVSHTRFPTNTPGWWGGAHPFNILDWSVVHNGELSSYGTNRRFLETYGYRCMMQTDTEVMAYAFDLLMRRQKLTVDLAAKILAPPLWSEIEEMPKEEGDLYKALRQVYGGILMNGPFSVIVARHGQMIGLADRIKLRPLSAAIHGDYVYMASEEAAIRTVCPYPDRVWRPRGGEPVVSTLKELTVEVPV